MLRLVMDTSVIVAGLRSRKGASNRLLRAVAEGRIRPLATTALFLEYEEVLARPEHRLATGLSEEGLQSFLAALASASEPVEVHFRWRPQLSDAADELVLEAAVNGRADALVTHNLGDFWKPAQRFGLKVLRPQECVKEFLQ